MFFNSFPYLFFILAVFFLYWFVTNKSLKAQNILLLVASYFFYSFWDWRFLFLLMFSTFLDYFTGLKIFNASTKKHKQIWLAISVVVNLGFLIFFKYFNFFSASFASLLSSMGFKANAATINIILPVGISFYTFHGLSYVFDIYNKKIKPSVNFVEYSLFVSFFPLLVAGPIERATHLLPQIEKPREFNYSKAIDGLRQILWGLFKKIVIADNCAGFANQIFNDPASYSGSTLVLGAVLFAFQIYGDFSGYSDIALGTARILGFELLQNFSFPYFSKDIAEFWRRWHISLSSWFRDYLYIPLGGSKVGTWRKVLNTFIIFIVSGFWHGANWTFIVWGFLNALYIMPLVLLNRNRNNLHIVAQGKIFPSISDLFKMILTFSLTVFAWIFFRAATITDALHYVRKIFSASLISKPQILPWYLFALLFFFIVIEWTGREHRFAIQRIGAKWPMVFRWAFYYAIVLVIFVYKGQLTQFIYFQF